MPIVEPIYTGQNCRPAFQLNWSLAVFPSSWFPPSSQWLEALRSATERDGVRILECDGAEPSTLLFFLSTLPHISPSRIVASIKGRLQYLVREQLPRALRRNYRITSVGAANIETIERYVGRQVEHHAPADPRWRRQLESIQYEDPAVDLWAIQYSSSGQFLNNLHVVLEYADGGHCFDTALLSASRDMIIRSCRAKGHRLSRVGLLSNHLHTTIGCGVQDSPESVALSLMNNLAYVHGMKPAFKWSYFAGTFGSYDRQAIRAHLPAQNPRTR